MLAAILLSFFSRNLSPIVVEVSANKSKVDLLGRWSTQSLTKDKSYIVEGCHITNGKLRVMIKDDCDRFEYYDYRNFEDMALKREQLLNKLFGGE